MAWRWRVVVRSHPPRPKISGRYVSAAMSRELFEWGSSGLPVSLASFTVHGQAKPGAKQRARATNDP